MIAQQAIGLVAISALASACADLYKRDGGNPAHIQKRQHIPNVVEDTRGWTFDQSEEWNTQNPAWGACFAGTQQSPIDLQTSWGFASSSPPVFNYPKALKGPLNNWDFGPQFTLGAVADDNTTEASIQFSQDGAEETAYFRSWHTHAPAEHTIDGYAPRAELHYVHYDDNNNPRAVVGFFVDLATAENPASESAFYKQLENLTLPDIFTNQTIPEITLDLNLAISEANEYKNFWTYKGSLTTPPCLEGLRWFVSKDIIYVSSAQLESLLKVSTFGARPVNRVWGHEVNAVVNTTRQASQGQGSKKSNQEQGSKKSSLLRLNLNIGK